MRRNALLIVLASGCGAGGSSSEGTSFEYEDTTGARFARVCNSSSCTQERLDEDGCGETAGMLGGRLLTICTRIGSSSFDENCRPVACESDVECESAHGFDVAYGCNEEGLCEDPTRTAEGYARADVFSLCLEGISRSQWCKTGVDTDPIGAAFVAQQACPLECTGLPSECR